MKARNEAILAEIEKIGGAFVWETETFAILLMDVAVSDQQALVLLGLSGVEHIALNVSGVSTSVLNSIAQIPELKSLVITGRPIAAEALTVLRSFGPKITIV